MNPEVLERPFVAIALAEIDPDYVHPETGQTLEQIAHRMPVNGMTRRPDVIL
jgi:7,8-dihydro-6-hydroxymethylpterin-pyrophosphokinase